MKKEKEEIKMARPQSKMDLLQESQKNYNKLGELLEKIASEGITTALDFSDEPKRKEAHWMRDKDVKDVLIHLYEWHQLMIHFVENNLAGKERPFLPEPYNWRTYGEMNVAFVQKHEKTSLAEAKDSLQASHTRVMELIGTFSNEELFTKDVYPWSGNNALGSYFVSVTSSHYDWAIKKLKAHIRKQTL